MSNPAVVNVSPAPNSKDVVLGQSIVVTFSEPINNDSFNNSTFALVGPNLSSIVTPAELIEEHPTPAQGRGYILGTFDFNIQNFQQWSAFTTYTLGQQVVDSNGNVETVVGPSGNAYNEGLYGNGPYGGAGSTSGPYAPTWSTTTGDNTTDNNIPGWQSVFSYVFGNYILDPNGNLQKCTVSVGPSGSSIPNPFNTVLNGNTFDGGITWTNYGPLNPIIWLNGGKANSNQTIATFAPSRPLLPGTCYTVLIVGADSVLASGYVEDVSGNPMLQSYQWTFTTGTLDISVPPVQNPVQSSPASYLCVDDIIVIPRPPVGNDLTQTIELIFPAAIDTSTFDPSCVTIGVEAILNDPTVYVSPGITGTYIIQGNKLIVTITGLS